MKITYLALSCLGLGLLFIGAGTNIFTKWPMGSYHLRRYYIRELILHGLVMILEIPLIIIGIIIGEWYFINIILFIIQLPPMIISLRFLYNDGKAKKVAEEANKTDLEW